MFCEEGKVCIKIKGWFKDKDKDKLKEKDKDKDGDKEKFE